MKLTFLEDADGRPYSKVYEKQPGGSLKTSGYPNVFLVTSHEEQVEDLEQFTQALITHGAAGHCLLSNSLVKPLNKESRAKHQVKGEKRQWVVFDIDGLAGVTSIEDFVKKCLPAEFQDVSYAVQWSPSHGIKPGIRAHIYYLTTHPVDADAVGRWTASLNLTNPLLSNEVTLSNSQMSLSYPLDRVASANGRIIYIAPPTLPDDMEDPVGERIYVVHKSAPTLDYNFYLQASPAELTIKIRDKVNDLRRQAGLSVSKKQSHVRVNPDGTEVLDPSLIQQGSVTEWIEDNDRFMRVNINGGDSFAYFYHRDQEDPLLHNFKGEPAMKLRIFDPQFYKDHVEPHFDIMARRMERPFVFHVHDRDQHFVGTRRDTEIIKQPKKRGSRQNIEDWFSFYGTSPPAVIPEWDIVFDPTNDVQWLENKRTFNTWRPTELMKVDGMVSPRVGPVIEKVLRHALGNDEECYDRFLNWVAYIFQNRTKTGTAWVIHGVQGTGKGLIFHHILSPIFGKDYCMAKQVKDLDDKFNEWMEQCLLLNVDEANISDSRFDKSKIINAVKLWITEKFISVRRMQASSQTVETFTNFIFTTNDMGGLPIAEGDRRFNVAPRQEEMIDITSDEVKEIKNELPAFAQFLKVYDVDREAAHTPLQNYAKVTLQDIIRSSIDSFFKAFKDRDMDLLIEALDEDYPPIMGAIHRKYADAVERWMNDVKAGQSSIVTEKELKAAHIMMCRDKPMHTSAFRSMYLKRGVPAATRLNAENRGLGRPIGWRITWRLSPELIEAGLHLKPVELPEDAVKRNIEKSDDSE